MLQTYCKALWGATHRSGCLCPSWAWVSRSNQWLFSASCLLFLSLSLSLSRPQYTDCATEQSVYVSLAHIHHVCVFDSVRERERYTPFPLMLPPPLSPLPHDSSLERVCVCVHVHVCVSHSCPEARGFLQGGCHTAMSGSNKCIFIFSLLWIGRGHTCVMLASQGRAEEIRSFICKL